MFLLLRDEYWINETGESGDGYALASFPHCGGGSYTLDPDTVTIVHYGATEGETPPARSAIVRDYDNRTRMPFATTGSPSSVAIASSEHSVAVFNLSSPFNHTRVLATVVFNQDSIRVNGVELHEGDSTGVRSVYHESYQGKKYEITEDLFFSHRGPAPLEERYHEQPCI